MNNPIAFPLQDLFDRLTVLNGLLTHLKTQHNNYIPLLKQELDKHGMDHSTRLASETLAVRDLTQPAQDFRGYYPMGTFTSNGIDEYEKVLNDLVYRNSNWTVAQAYEAFDSFLKMTIAIYICKNFNSVEAFIKKDLKNTAKSLSNLKTKGLSENSIDYWREFVSLARWNNEKILSKIRSNFAQALKTIENNNESAIDLQEWFALVGKLRHAVTHSNGVTKKFSTRWSLERRDQLFPGTETELGFEFLLDTSHARRNVELFAEYAYVIFKCLSIEQGYDINILEK